MERLHQIARAFAFIGYCTLSLCTTSAQNKCSLVVRVLSPNGQRIEVPVSVQEKNGNIEQKDQEGGDVRFCDLGILPVTVIVGKDGF